MAKINFNDIEKTEKIAIFQAISTTKGMTPFAVEKDWWVSRTMDIIFKMPIAKHLVFKGGTSLSKAWKIINRFSEDVDLAIDKEFFEGYGGNISKTKIKKLRKIAGEYSSRIFFEELKDQFIAKGYKDLRFKIVDAKDTDQDPRIIEIYYPNVISQPSEYVLPRVQVEIGCRSLREPFTTQSFGSLVDEEYENKAFAAPLFEVPTVNPERTFLEKIFLLHEEFHRPIEKIRVNRLSRHLYDVYHLIASGIAERAINDKELYETIVMHRHKFSRVGGVDYNLHNPKTLNPIPIKDITDAWEADYATMREEMIYENNAPSYKQLIENLKVLRNQLQNLKWQFDIEFPKQK
ncbi:MAG: nucleotidyl transferase AbiEii/AbiGii toxin family protein [Chitinophagales bacterium]